MTGQVACEYLTRRHSGQLSPVFISAGGGTVLGLTMSGAHVFLRALLQVNDGL